MVVHSVDRSAMVDKAEAPPTAVAGVDAVAEADRLRRDLAKAVAAQTSLAKALQQAWAREEAAENEKKNSGSMAELSVVETSNDRDSIGAVDAGTLAAAVASTEAAFVEST